MADNCFSDTTDNTWEDTTDNTWEKCVVIPGGHVPRLEVLKDKISLKDYGRKPYLTTYSDMMKQPTLSAIQNELKERYGIFEPKSEFEKPYVSKNYEEMQHYYPFPLSMGEFEFPNFSGPLPEIGSRGIGWYMTGCSLTCDTILIRKCDREYCCMLNPAFQPVSKIEIKGPAYLTKKGKTTGSKICFKLTDDAVARDEVIIKVSTKAYPNQKTGGYCEGSIRVACDKCDCDVEANISYDDTNSDDTIDRDGIAVITVASGCPPYNWSVAGTGFSLSKASTSTLTNTLIADDTACGSATITVTDKCGDNCTGYVRCTTGRWVSKEVGYKCQDTDYCGTAQSAECGYATSLVITEGNKQWGILLSYCTFQHGATSCSWDWSTVNTPLCGGGSPVSHPPPCGSPSDCHPNDCSGGTCSGKSCVGCVFGQYGYNEWEC